MLFGLGLIGGRTYSRGLVVLFDTLCIKSSLSKLLFSIILKEQSKFRHLSYQSLHHHLGWGLIRKGLIKFVKFFDFFYTKTEQNF